MMRIRSLRSQNFVGLTVILARVPHCSSKSGGMVGKPGNVCTKY